VSRPKTTQGSNADRLWGSLKWRQLQKWQLCFLRWCTLQVSESTLGGDSISRPSEARTRWKNDNGAEESSIVPFQLHAENRDRGSGIINAERRIGLGYKQAAILGTLLASAFSRRRCGGAGNEYHSVWSLRPFARWYRRNGFTSATLPTRNGSITRERSWRKINW
jgi:hypothetical protein